MGLLTLNPKLMNILMKDGLLRIRLTPYLILPPSLEALGGEPFRYLRV